MSCEATPGLMPRGAQHGRGRFIRPKRASSANMIRKRRPRPGGRPLGFPSQHVAQYKRRLNDFDYDVVTARFGLGLTPGEGMRSTFGSEAASLPGSHNLSGITNEAVDDLIEKALVAETREELTFICRAIDRILRSGHYWVPMWNKPNHLVAYWDVFGRPERSPKYDMGVVSTWWYDEEKAKRIHFAGR